MMLSGDGVESEVISIHTCAFRWMRGGYHNHNFWPFGHVWGCMVIMVNRNLTMTIPKVRYFLWSLWSNLTMTIPKVRYFLWSNLTMTIPKLWYFLWSYYGQPKFDLGHAILEHYYIRTYYIRTQNSENTPPTMLSTGNQLLKVLVQRVQSRWGLSSSLRLQDLHDIAGGILSKFNWYWCFT